LITHRILLKIDCTKQDHSQPPTRPDLNNQKPVHMLQNSAGYASEDCKPRLISAQCKILQFISNPNHPKDTKADHKHIK